MLVFPNTLRTSFSKGRPNITIKDVLYNDTGLNIHDETLIVIADGENWRKKLHHVTELTFGCS